MSSTPSATGFIRVQALADMVTLEASGGFKGAKLAFVGDGNNITHSLLLWMRLGLCCSTPPGYEPNLDIFATGTGLRG